LIRRAQLVSLGDALDSGELAWPTFAAEVKKVHRYSVGGPYAREPGDVPKLEEYFYANPMPECICRDKQQQQLNRRLLKGGASPNSED
jgi:hypothetical protein